MGFLCEFLASPRGRQLDWKFVVAATVVEMAWGSALRPRIAPNVIHSINRCVEAWELDRVRGGARVKQCPLR